MDNSAWTLDGEKKSCTLAFLNPENESIYSSIRFNRTFSLVPRIIMFAICFAIMLRRVQLLVAAATSQSQAKYGDELRIFGITTGTLVLELTTHFCDRLASFRCTPLVLLFFYTAADGSVTYYLDRVPDEPVYAFRYCPACVEQH